MASILPGDKTQISKSSQNAPVQGGPAAIIKNLDKLIHFVEHAHRPPPPTQKTGLESRRSMTEPAESQLIRELGQPIIPSPNTDNNNNGNDHRETVSIEKPIENLENPKIKSQSNPLHNNNLETVKLQSEPSESSRLLHNHNSPQQHNDDDRSTFTEDESLEKEEMGLVQNQKNSNPKIITRSLVPDQQNQELPSNVEPNTSLITKKTDNPNKLNAKQKDNDVLLQSKSSNKAQARKGIVENRQSLPNNQIINEQLLSNQNDIEIDNNNSKAPKNQPEPSNKLLDSPIDDDAEQSAQYSGDDGYQVVDNQNSNDSDDIEEQQSTNSLLSSDDNDVGQLSAGNNDNATQSPAHPLVVDNQPPPGNANRQMTSALVSYPKAHRNWPSGPPAPDKTGAAKHANWGDKGLGRVEFTKDLDLGIAYSSGAVSKGLQADQGVHKNDDLHGDYLDHAKWVTGPTAVGERVIALGQYGAIAYRYVARKEQLAAVRKDIARLENERDTTPNQDIKADKQKKIDALELTKEVLVNDLKISGKRVVHAGAVTLDTAKTVMAGVAISQSSNAAATAKDVFLNQSMSKEIAKTVLGHIASAAAGVASILWGAWFAKTAWEGVKSFWNQRKLINNWEKHGSLSSKFAADNADTAAVRAVALRIEAKVRKNKKQNMGKALAYGLRAVGSVGSAVITGLTVASVIVSAPVTAPILGCVAASAAVGYYSYRLGRHAFSYLAKAKYRDAQKVIAKEFNDDQYSDLNKHQPSKSFRTNKNVGEMISEFNRVHANDQDFAAIDQASMNKADLQQLMDHVVMGLLERDTKTATGEIYLRLKSSPITENDYESNQNLPAAAQLMKELGVSYDKLKKIIDSDDHGLAQKQLAKCMMLA